MIEDNVFGGLPAFRRKSIFKHSSAAMFSLFLLSFGIPAHGGSVVRSELPSESRAFIGSHSPFVVIGAHRHPYSDSPDKLLIYADGKFDAPMLELEPALGFLTAISVSFNTVTVDGLFDEPSMALRLLAGEWEVAYTIDAGISAAQDDGFAILRTRPSKLNWYEDDVGIEIMGDPIHKLSEENDDSPGALNFECGPQDRRPCQELVVYRFRDGVQLEVVAAFELDPAENGTAITASPDRIHVATTINSTEHSRGLVHHFARLDTGEWVARGTTSLPNSSTTKLLTSGKDVYTLWNIDYGPEDVWYKVRIDLIAYEEDGFAFRGPISRPGEMNEKISSDFNTEANFHIGQDLASIVCISDNSLFGAYRTRLLRFDSHLKAWAETGLSDSVPDGYEIRSISCLDDSIAAVVVPEGQTDEWANGELLILRFKDDSR